MSASGLRTRLTKLAGPGAAATAMLLAWGLRIYRLGDANVHWDEALAVWVARKGPVGAALWTAGDAHPPLYYWLVWAWSRLVGEGEFGLRALFAMMGVLTVAAAYALAARIGGRRAGVLAGLLVAGARFHVWWSQDVRMYGPAALWGALSLLFLLRWLAAEEARTRQPIEVGRPAAISGPSDHRLSAGASASLASIRRRLAGPSAGLVGYTLCALAALYTVYLVGVLLLAHNLVVLVALAGERIPRRRLLWRWIASQAVVLLGLAGWMILSWGHMKATSSGPRPTLGHIARLYGTLASVGISTHIERYGLATLLVASVIVLGTMAAYLSNRRRGPAGRLSLVRFLSLLGLVLCAAAPLPALYLATQPTGLWYAPALEARYLLPFAIYVWILLALALVALWRRWRQVGYVATLAIAALWITMLPGYYRGRHQSPGPRSLAQAIVAQARSGDVVLLVSGSRLPVFLYDYRQAGGAGFFAPVIPVSPSSGGVLRYQEAEGYLNSLPGDTARVWLAEVDVGLEDSGRVLRQVLDDRWPRVLAHAYGPDSLYLYDPAGLPPTYAHDTYLPSNAVDVSVAGGRLLGWDLSTRIYRPGDAIHLALYWEITPSEPSSVSLCDSAGIALVTRLLPEEPGLHAVRLPVDLPVWRTIASGQYTLVLSADERDLVLTDLRVRNPDLLAPVQPEVWMGGRFRAAGSRDAAAEIVLEGYALRDLAGRPLRTVRPGDTLVLDLYWRASGPVDEDLLVFTHLVGTAYNPRTLGPLWGQHDGRPAEGGHPTSRWTAGEQVADRHVITVDGDAPEGSYRLAVGMYRPSGGERLRTVDGDDQVLLTDIVDVHR